MGMRKLGASADSMITAMKVLFNITKEYILSLLMLKKA